MKRLVLMAASLAVFGGAAYYGSTGAFFSDSETSTGNTFTAGAIDLKVDSTQHYNGNTCTLVTAAASSSYLWTGNSAYPTGPCSGTWTLKDLNPTLDKFFNFPDIKPGDNGENTVSLHIDNNDSYACVDISNVANNDNTQTEPEALVDANGLTTGELAQNLNFIVWKDDGAIDGWQGTEADPTEGDNIWQAGEDLLTSGTAPTTAQTYTLANSVTGPLLGGTTGYVGVAWCAGTWSSIAPNATCNGATMGNIAQTDSYAADIAFRVEQARNNPNFTCTPQVVGPTTGTLTVTKVVTNDNGGTKIVSDFPLFLNGMGIVSGVSTTTSAGAHIVSETGSAGYQATFGGDCDAAGNVTVPAGGNATCTVTNNDIAPTITLIKSVVNNGPGTPGTAVAGDFTMRVNGTPVPNNSSISVNANTNIQITEDAVAGYSFSSLVGVSCPAALATNFQLGLAQSITCTITNDDNGTE